MRILMLTSSYLPKLNGVTRTVRTLSEGLGRRGHHVVVVTRWRKGLLRESGSGSTRVVRAGRGRGLGESLFFWAAMTSFTIRSCRKKEFQIVHAHGTISALSAVCGWLIGGVPFLVSFHQDALIGWETGYDQLHGFKHNFARFLQARICNLAAVVTVQSTEVKGITERVLRLNGKIRVAVLPNTVDVALFSTEGSPAPSNRNILFVGNLIKRKGVDVLLRAMAILVDSFPDAQLTIVGNGPEKASLLNLAMELRVSSKVNFVDEVDDRTLASLYQRTAAVVLPSYSEVFGIVILEALAANRPVVVTATVGARSIITDMVSGRVVPIGDSQGIASAIVHLFANHESAIAMAREAHQLALSMYSVEVVTKRLEWLYQSAAYSPMNLVE